MTEPTTQELEANVVDAPEEDAGIRHFLEGFSPKEGVVAIEGEYDQNIVNLTVHDPKTGEKSQERSSYNPFVFMKDFRRLGVKFYENNKQKVQSAKAKHQITIEPLRTTDDNGASVDRLENGYKFLVSTSSTRGYNAIADFFRDGDVALWGRVERKPIFRPSAPATPTNGDIYGLIDAKDGINMWYNHILSRYELHVNAQGVTRSKLGEDETEVLFRVKMDGVMLLEGKDFQTIYHDAQDKYIIALTDHDPQAEIKTTAVMAALENKIKSFELTALEASGGEPCLRRSINTYVADSLGIGEEVPETYQLENTADWLKNLGFTAKHIPKDLNRIIKAHNSYLGYKAKLAAEIKKQHDKVPIKNKVRDAKKIQLFYREANNDFFFSVKREEQYMIQKGIRLFKGFDNYGDVHKAIFDIETTGLNARRGDRIFMIGCKDNRGIDNLLAVNKPDDDEEEKRIITDFFFWLQYVKPAIIYGYNSENFDFDFILARAEILNLDISQLPTSFFFGKSMKRKAGATLKLGGDTENYTQTLIPGASVIDIYHAVRRTQAINSDLKEAKLKYVCKYEGIAKPNRVYVPGDKIYTIWNENKLYAVHKGTNEYVVLPDSAQDVASVSELKDGKWTYEDVSPYGNNTIYQRGKKLVKQYLIDDLWETEQVDSRYNEDRFLLGKYLPTFFTRTCTMGGASTWNLIMSAWSYENKIAIPYALRAKTFTGGLSRTFMLGKFINVFKFDFSGLYPSLQLEHNIFPKHDVTGVLKRLLLYFKNTRDRFKFLAGDNSPLPKDERKPFKAKQLPLKILNNSNFGANGSAFFNWADFTCAERITCTGRLYLRNMIQFFQQWECKPTVCDTDGINMEVPALVNADINGVKLAEPMPIERLRFTDGDKLYIGADALVARYNTEVLDSPYMKLDNDGMWPTAINISRKNYANKEAPDEKGKEKIKFVGNTIKQKTMSEYIKEFIDKGLEMLLDDDGKGFVEYYYQYLTKIYMRQIPLKNIASKARIRMTVDEYDNRGTDKNGRLKGKQAHMELIKQENVRVNLGDVVYYVSTGHKHTQAASAVDKESGKIMAKLITNESMEANPEQLGEYNIPLYVNLFNKRVESLLVPFKPEVRNTIIKPDPTEREFYSDDQMKLIQFQNPEEKDNIDNFFILEKSEVNFWNRTGFDPRKILTDFETEAEYDGYEYADKLYAVQEKLEKHNLTVRHHLEAFKNGDMVLTFDRVGYAINPLTDEKVRVPNDYYRYVIGDVDGPVLPPDNEIYHEVKRFTGWYGEHTKIIPGKEYRLCRVEKGELEVLRTL